MDETYLRRALQLADTGAALGEGGPFGALVVRDGTILGEGWNCVLKRHDPTAHAEIVAIRAACEQMGNHHLHGCTLYTSSEPCPMCLAAAYWARIDRIVFANPRSVATEAGFCDGDLYRELQIPADQRRIPMIGLPIADADAPFKHWLAKPDAQTY